MLALGGLLFGVLANAVFFVNSADIRGRETPSLGEAPSPPPPLAPEPNPWAILGVAPTAPPGEIALRCVHRSARAHSSAPTARAPIRSFPGSASSGVSSSID